MDPTGLPIVDASVTLLTATTDQVGTSQATGIAHFPKVEIQDYVVNLAPAPDTDCQPVAVVRVEAPGHSIDFQSPSPALPIAIDDTPSEVEVAPGLHLKVAADQLNPPPFTSPIASVGACVPTGWPEIPGADEVLQVWYLWPAEARPTDELPVRIDDVWSRTGTHLWTLQVNDPNGVEGGWHDEGPLQSSAGGLTGSLTRYNAVAVVIPSP